MSGTKVNAALWYGHDGQAVGLALQVVQAQRVGREMLFLMVLALVASAYGHRARALALFGLYVHRSHTGQHLQDAHLLDYVAALHMEHLLMMIMLDKCSKMTFWDTLHSLPPGPLLHVRGVRHELSRHGHLVGVRPYSGPVPGAAHQAGGRSLLLVVDRGAQCAPYGGQCTAVRHLRQAGLGRSRQVRHSGHRNFTVGTVPAGGWSWPACYRGPSHSS